jgi:hypothetical protein
LRGVRPVGELALAAADSSKMECWRVAGVRGGASVDGLDGSCLLHLFAPRTTLSRSGRVFLSATWLRVGTVLGSDPALTVVHLDAFFVIDCGGRGRGFASRQHRMPAEPLRGRRCFVGPGKQQYNLRLMRRPDRWSVGVGHSSRWPRESLTDHHEWIPRTRNLFRTS